MICTFGDDKAEAVRGSAEPKSGPIPCPAPEAAPEAAPDETPPVARVAIASGKSLSPSE